MSQVPRYMTGPANQHKLRKPRSVSNFEAYENIQKCFFKDSISVQIPGWGRTLHLANDMNDQMIEFDIQIKGESWHFAKKTKHNQLRS